ncbi:SDR family oxidoreductase, partial [Streptococcus parasanguinis]
IIFTYALDRNEKSIRELAETLNRKDYLILQCDVESDEQIQSCFQTIKNEAGTIDGIAHCVAFARREELKG